jgi:hypothetical protein
MLEVTVTAPALWTLSLTEVAIDRLDEHRRPGSSVCAIPQIEVERRTRGATWSSVILLMRPARDRARSSPCRVFDDVHFVADRPCPARRECRLQLLDTMRSTSVSVLRLRRSRDRPFHVDPRVAGRHEQIAGADDKDSEKHGGVARRAVGT